MLLGQKKIEEGGMLPWGYGVAWDKIDTRQVVCYPMPFNWVAAFLRVMWYKLIVPKKLRAAQIKYHFRRCPHCGQEREDYGK